MREQRAITHKSLKNVIKWRFFDALWRLYLATEKTPVLPRPRAEDMAMLERFARTGFVAFVEDGKNITLFFSATLAIALCHEAIRRRQVRERDSRDTLQGFAL